MSHAPSNHERPDGPAPRPVHVPPPSPDNLTHLLAPPRSPALSTIGHFTGILKDLETIRCANGVTIHLLPSARPHTSLIIRTAIGSRDEPPGLEGATHLLEHLSFRAVMANEEMRPKLSRIGGLLPRENGSGDREYADLRWSGSAEYSLHALQLLFYAATHERLPARHFAAERRVVAQEQREILADVEATSSLALEQLLFPGHPISRITGGTPEAVRELDYDRVYDYRATALTSEQLHVVAVGGPVERLRDEIIGRFGDLPDRKTNLTRTPVAKLPPRPPLERFAVIPGPADHIEVRLGFPSYPISHPDGIAADIIRVMLGHPTSGLLFSKLRHEGGMTYRVGAARTSYRDSGYFSIGFGTESDLVVPAIQETFDLLRSLGEGKFDRNSLEGIKVRLAGHVMMMSEYDPAPHLAEGSALAGQVLPPEEIVSAIDRVDPDTISRVSATIFCQSEACLALAGDGERYRPALCELL